MGAVPDMTIWRNAVHCNICGITIESIHRHDFVRCRCTTDDTAVWVDGGHAYNRRMFGKDCDYTEIDEEFIPEPPHKLEHSAVMINNVHHRSRCAGEHCTIHNMSDHSKRMWLQYWDPRRGMRRISPTTGRSYKDPDSP